MGIVDIRVDIRTPFLPAAPADGGMSSLRLLFCCTGHGPQRGRCIYMPPNPARGTRRFSFAPAPIPEKLTQHE